MNTIRCTIAFCTAALVPGPLVTSGPETSITASLPAAVPTLWVLWLPYTSGERTGAKNIVVQDQCAADPSEHLAVAYDPIVVEEGSVMVENQTGSDWKDVRIVVNDHYNGGVPTLKAGQRVNAPLSQFQSGLGYRYDRGRMSPYKVEVTATDSRGQAVNLMWGENKTAK